MSLGIFDLRQRSHHADAVAVRIWNAFWKQKGTPLTQIRSGLEAFLKAASRIPFALVAEDKGRICGNVLVIDDDEPARPELGPWIAAVWVDEDRRGLGIARAMIEEAVRRAAALGVARLYLVSRPALRGFYKGLGWRELEDQVGEHRLVLYARELDAVPSRS